MNNYKKTLKTKLHNFIGKGFKSVTLAVIVSVLFVTTVVTAATTINENINTAGTLTVTGASTLATTTIASDLTVDTDTLYVDSVNGRVGVGTVNPIYQLDQNKTEIIPLNNLTRLQRLTYNVSGVGSDLTTQGTRTLEINTNLSGTYDMGTISGLYTNTYNNSTAGSITHLIGNVGRIFNTSSGNVIKAFGVYGGINSSGVGIINDAYGLYANSPLMTNGTITNYFGIATEYSVPSGGTIENAYGAYFQKPSGATNNNIGLIVGGAPGGSYNLAAYFNGAVSVNGALSVSGLFTPSADVYLGTFNLDYNQAGLFQVKNKAGSSWINFITRDISGSEAVVNLSNIGTLKITGNVGIGTTSPSVKLDTYGGMMRAFNVASSTCDSTTRGGIFYNELNDSFWGCKSSGFVKLDN